MTNYLTPLDQRWAADQAAMMQHIATLERQIASMAAPQLLAKTVLAAPTATVPLPATGSIPQNYTNLRLVMSLKSDGTGGSGYDQVNMQFNGVTSGYSWDSWWLTQGSTSLGAATGTSASSMPVANSWSSRFASSGRGIATVNIPGYSDTTTYKGFTSQTASSDGGAAGIKQDYSGALSGTTAAITSLTLTMSTGNFVAGCTFCLYGS